MQHREDLGEYKRTFSELLLGVDPAAVSSEPFCIKYLQYLLEHKEYFLEIYTDVLERTLLLAEKPKEEISLIDFGAGNGLLGIFAKYCGFKKAYVNDIDEKFVAAAQQLSAQLNIATDGFIAGDADVLLPYFSNEKPDAIVGTDVIEHIYDLPAFFSILKQLNPSIVSVFTTASNPDNLFKVRRLQKLQRKDELQGGTPEDSVLFGAAPHASYLKMREDIIRDNFTLAEDKIKPLAKATRGLIKKDIIAAVQKSLETGVMPRVAAHSTNTCNPLTGSWTERILTINEYAYIYNTAGFTLDLYPGFYDVHKGLAKSVLNKILNAGVKIMGKTFAPYIVLTGSKK